MNAQNKKQNKNILHGLPALLFASAVASCTCEKNPSAEEIVISEDYKDKEIGCLTADVVMDKDGYTILCDKNHYFNHNRYFDELRWGRIVYSDLNHDGLVDAIYMVDVGQMFFKHQPKIYDEKLFILRKNEIHQRWELH